MGTADQREDLDAVDARLTSVERRMWAASGGAAVLGTIAGYAGQFLGK
ncbi:hypothetical protein ABZ468_31600 [Streptomyces sp. NPDC005708]